MAALANGNYGVQVYESGAYTKFDSPELLQTWTNPVTGKVIEVLPFLGARYRQSMARTDWCFHRSVKPKRNFSTSKSLATP